MFTQFKVEPHVPSAEMAAMRGLNEQAVILMNLSAQQAKLIMEPDNIKQQPDIESRIQSNRDAIKKAVSTIKDLCNLIELVDKLSIKHE